MKWRGGMRLEPRMVVPTTVNKMTALLPTATFPHLELGKPRPILPPTKHTVGCDHSVTYCS
jgi:hypothetical protein